jgi:hypothetical protein
VLSDIVPGVHTIKSVTPQGDAVAKFEFQPGEAPKLLELPATPTPATLAVASYDGKASARCNCPKSKFTAGGQSTLFEDAALEFDLAAGENPMELDVLGGKKLAVNSRGGPELLLGMFWAAPKPAARPLDIERAINEARKLLDTGEFRKADALIDRVLAQSPNNPGALRIKRELVEIKARAPDKW